MMEAFGHEPLFEDRVDAGRQLGARLRDYGSEPVVVLALPRGGVVVGYEVARALHAPMDVLVARKLGAPGRPELGIGAIAPGGVRVLDEPAIVWLRITPEQLEEVTAQETAELGRRMELYHAGRPPVDVRGKIAILVDDGLATGGTARAAIASLKLRQPERIVLAVPVCAPETARAIADEVDDIVCLASPSDFRAVGYWYGDFGQTTDEEVLELLNAERPSQGAER
jgi:predicted phosphoribosyltransferase